MRLWSLHPRYLDRRALVALWREGLLAQAVLRGRTKGYTAHPQLARFQATAAPVRSIAHYLRGVHAEATRRGYTFDGSKLAAVRGPVPRIPVTRGQLAYELEHLRKKVKTRDPDWLRNVPARAAAPHPSLRAVRGGIEHWERP